jgi:hypothetical protein
VGTRTNVIRTQIQLTEEQMSALKEAAARRGASVAELVRSGVDAVLRESGPSDFDRWARAAGASGRFSSGTPDLARRHDDHLVAAFDE